MQLSCHTISISHAELRCKCVLCSLKRKHCICLWQLCQWCKHTHRIRSQTPVCLHAGCLTLKTHLNTVAVESETRPPCSSEQLSPSSGVIHTMSSKTSPIWSREEIITIIIMRIILTGPALYANEGNHLPRQARLIAPSLISWINITFLSERAAAPSGGERVSGRMFGWNNKRVAFLSARGSTHDSSRAAQMRDRT